MSKQEEPVIVLLTQLVDHALIASPEPPFGGPNVPGHGREC